MIRTLTIICCALLIALGWVAFDRSLIKRELGAAQSVLEQERAKAKQDAAAASATYRERESQWTKSQQETQHAATEALTRAADDRRGADSARQRLLVAASAAASSSSRCPQSASVASGSETAASAVMVSNDLLSWAISRAGALAELADQRGIAGEACESAYGALTR